MLRSTAQDSSEHVAAFHASDAFIITQAAAFIAAGLDAGERVIALATQAHWNAIANELERGGISPGRATADGRLVLIEADQLVETLTAGGRADVDAFRATLAPFIKPAGKVRIYGQVVSLLVARGDLDGALAIERLGHELTRTLKLNILCAYRVAGSRPLQRPDIEQIQQLHDRSVFEERSTLESPKAAEDPTRRLHAENITAITNMSRQTT